MAEEKWQYEDAQGCTGAKLFGAVKTLVQEPQVNSNTKNTLQSIAAMEELITRIIHRLFLGKMKLTHRQLRFLVGEAVRQELLGMPVKMKADVVSPPPVEVQEQLPKPLLRFSSCKSGSLFSHRDPLSNISQQATSCDPVQRYSPKTEGYSPTQGECFTRKHFERFSPKQVEGLSPSLRLNVCLPVKPMNSPPPYPGEARTSPGHPTTDAASSPYNITPIAPMYAFVRPAPKESRVSFSHDSQGIQSATSRKSIVSRMKAFASQRSASADNVFLRRKRLFPAALLQRPSGGEPRPEVCHKTAPVDLSVKRPRTNSRGFHEFSLRFPKDALEASY